MNTRKAYHSAVALGYVYNDHFRSELMIANVTPIMVAKRVTETAPLKTVEARHHPFVSSFETNLYIDLFAKDFIRPFLTLGCGLAIVSDKIIHTTKENSIPAVSETIKSRANYNLAANIGVGLTFDAAEFGVVELGYRFSDYGRTKRTLYKDSNNITDRGRLNLREHLFTFAYRFFIY